MTWPSCASELSMPTGKRLCRSARRWARQPCPGATRPPSSWVIRPARSACGSSSSSPNPNTSNSTDPLVIVQVALFVEFETVDHGRHQPVLILVGIKQHDIDMHDGEHQEEP